MAVSIFKRPLNKEVEQIKNDIGIVENGTTATHNIASGQYVIWQGNLCTALYAILPGDTLSSSNMIAVSNGGLNALNGNMTKRKKRVLLGQILTPAGSTNVDLSHPVTDYEYVQVWFVKSGTTGMFTGQILSTDDVSIGGYDTISFSAYNNASYNFYAEGGFSTASRFNIATYRSTGWTMSKCYVVGIGEK